MPDYIEYSCTVENCIFNPNKRVGMDPINTAHAVSREGWQGVLRGVCCAAIAGAIGWHNSEVAKYSLGVIALVASPALAKAIIAPRLAALLNKQAIGDQNDSTGS